MKFGIACLSACLLPACLPVAYLPYYLPLLLVTSCITRVKFAYILRVDSLRAHLLACLLAACCCLLPAACCYYCCCNSLFRSLSLLPTTYSADPHSRFHLRKKKKKILTHLPPPPPIFASPAPNLSCRSSIFWQLPLFHPTPSRCSFTTARISYLIGNRCTPVAIVVALHRSASGTGAALSVRFFLVGVWHCVHREIVVLLANEPHRTSGHSGATRSLVWIQRKISYCHPASFGSLPLSRDPTLSISCPFQALVSGSFLFGLPKLKS